MEDCRVSVPSVIDRYKEITSGVANDSVANDAFSNVTARMGYGTPSLVEATDYELVRWSNNYMLMVTLFRNHWISRRIVEKPAQHMCKAWAKVQTSELKTDEVAKFDRLINRTHTKAKIQESITWARLFGGAGALMVIDGHETILDQPLELEDINPGTYKGLIPFDRWSGITPSSEIGTDISRPIDYNLPEYYKVQGENDDTFNVHASRILRFSGPRVPRPENQAQMHWGISELEIAYEEIRKRDNSSWAILSLMFRASILAYSNPSLAGMLSGLNSSGDAAQQFYRQMSALNEVLSNQSMLILPKDAQLFSHSYSFAGMAEIYNQFQMDISGAAEMPVSILFGRTATGLSQGNDAEMRIYEQNIGQKQQDELAPQLHKLYPVICMSEFGFVPDDIDIAFPAVRVLTEEEKSKIASDKVTAILAPFTAGVTSQKTTLLELKGISDETGLFQSITEQDIDKADENVIAPLEMQGAGDNFNDDSGEEDAKPPKKK
jgi:hypothetical protein